MLTETRKLASFHEIEPLGEVNGVTEECFLCRCKIDTRRSRGIERYAATGVDAGFV